MIARFAAGSFLPTTFGTLQRTRGGGGGGGGWADPTVNSPFMMLAWGSQTNL